ncbi:ABC transporter permease [uncultured Helicobacter sp.]|uniref:ABC transporter permease n=1 Tax=uncultured Helicobacter sp. TaxID=175537 RepID=UPI00374F59B5
MKKLIQLWKFLTRRFILFLLCFVLPILIGWFMYEIFSASIPKNLPIGFVDLDNTTTSADVRFSINASPTMYIHTYYTSIAQAKQDLATAKIYALAIIPRNFQQDIYLGKGACIALYYNAQFVLIGKALNSAFAQVIGTLNAQQSVAHNLIADQDMKLALSKAMPIFSQIIPLYNANNNYAQFLLTLLLPCMLQILSALAMVQLLKNRPYSFKSLFIRYIGNSCVFLIWGICMLLFLKNLGYELRGSLGLLIMGLTILMLGINGVVVFLQSILLDIKKSIGVIAVYTAPSLAFAGVTYPQNSMNLIALIWSKFLPISSFMELYVQQANYGGSVSGAMHILLQMCIFLIFFVLGSIIYTQRKTQ